MIAELCQLSLNLSQDFQLVLNEMGAGKKSWAWYLHSLEKCSYAVLKLFIVTRGEGEVNQGHVEIAKVDTCA